jgi:hypothetical protein
MSTSIRSRLEHQEAPPGGGPIRGGWAPRLPWALGCPLVAALLLAACGTPTTPSAVQSAASAGSSIAASASAALPSIFASASAAAGTGTNLTFSGSVSDSLTRATVVCTGTVFDIAGVSTAGKDVVLTGDATKLSHILLTYGTTPYNAHPSAGTAGGSVSMSSGTGTFHSLSLPIANPNQSGQVTVNGTFTCP